MENENPNRALDEAKILFNKGDLEGAKRILDDFINSNVEKYKETETTRYFSFGDALEFYCATRKLKLNKEMKWINCSLSEAYDVLSYMCSEEKNPSKAMEYIDKAIYYNPMNPNLYFEKSEIYKSEKNYNAMLEVTKEAYNYIYISKDLARYYRNLGFYYIECGKYEEAFAMYIASLNFENSDRAIGEIGYICALKNDPKFSVSLDKVKEILVNENISYGIKEENKVDLLSFLTIEEFSRYTKLIEFVREDIKIITREMRSTDEILFENENAKISCEDLIDENKIVKDELDIARGKMNTEYLRSIGISADDNLKVVPINSYTRLVSKEEVARAMITNYVIAYLSAEALYHEIDGDISGDLNALDSRFGVRKLFDVNDEFYVKSILNNELSKEKLSNSIWFYERCSVLMWCLGLRDKPSLSKQCTADSLFKILADMNSYEDLLGRCNLRSKEEIMEFDDLVTRASSAYREARQKGELIENLDYNILIEYRTALDSILNWSINNIMKEYINVNFKRGDYDFIFNMPTMLTFNENAPKRDKKCLFSLVSFNRLTTITLLDIGKISIDEFNNKYYNDVDSYKKDNWNVVRERNFKIDNIDSDVKELVINKIIPPVETPAVGLARYYFILNNRLVCLETLLDRNINYQDDTSISNSKNNLITLKILNSFMSNK